MKTVIDLIQELERQVKTGQLSETRTMNTRDKNEFKARHPWADLVVGDFEIRVINREKYGLDPQ